MLHVIDMISVKNRIINRVPSITLKGVYHDDRSN